MSAIHEDVAIAVDGQVLAGTLATPSTAMPGVLFVHGWGGDQQRDLERARDIAALGCICLTFDLRGHGATSDQLETVTREENLADVLAAYDRLTAHPAVDSSAIAVVGSSYGGYLAAILTELRPVRWLALRVPALYRDDEWHVPKRQLNREVLAAYRNAAVSASENRALRACSEFAGDVLLVESEQDHLVPHQTLLSYRSAFAKAHSLSYRLMDGADHALSTEEALRSYRVLLVNWITKMVLGARTGELY